MRVINTEEKNLMKLFTFKCQVLVQKTFTFTLEKKLCTIPAIYNTLSLKKYEYFYLIPTLMEKIMKIWKRN